MTVTRNEILTGINSPEQYILAIVEVEDRQARPLHYIRRPFSKEPDFEATSVNYEFKGASGAEHSAIVILGIEEVVDD